MAQYAIKGIMTMYNVVSWIDTQKKRYISSHKYKVVWSDFDHSNGHWRVDFSNGLENSMFQEFPNAQIHINTKNPDLYKAIDNRFNGGLTNFDEVIRFVRDYLAMIAKQSSNVEFIVIQHVNGKPIPSQFTIDSRPYGYSDTHLYVNW